MVLFLETASAPQACWTMIGLGIRLAQDIGAHRRKQQPRPTAENELWKRAFWLVTFLDLLKDVSLSFTRVLISIDRLISSALGRPCSMQDEE